MIIDGRGEREMGGKEGGREGCKGRGEEGVIIDGRGEREMGGREGGRDGRGGERKVRGK